MITAAIIDYVVGPYLQVADAVFCSAFSKCIFEQPHGIVTFMPPPASDNAEPMIVHYRNGIILNLFEVMRQAMLIDVRETLYGIAHSYIGPRNLTNDILRSFSRSLDTRLLYRSRDRTLVHTIQHNRVKYNGYSDKSFIDVVKCVGATYVEVANQHACCMYELPINYGDRVTDVHISCDPGIFRITISIECDQNWLAHIT